MANDHLDQALTGAFIQFAVVTDLGTTTETESIIGFTMGETNLSREPTNSEFNFHEARLTYRADLHEALTVEFVTAVVDNHSPLETMGIIDASGNYQGAQSVDLRVYVYDQVPADATSAGAVVELTNTELGFGEMSLPQDGSETTMTGKVNGSIKFSKTTA